MTRWTAFTDDGFLGPCSDVHYRIKPVFNAVAPKGPQITLIIYRLSVSSFQLRDVLWFYSYHLFLLTFVPLSQTFILKETSHLLNTLCWSRSQIFDISLCFWFLFISKAVFWFQMCSLRTIAQNCGSKREILSSQSAWKQCQHHVQSFIAASNWKHFGAPSVLLYTLILKSKLIVLLF